LEEYGTAFRIVVNRELKRLLQPRLMFFFISILFMEIIWVLMGSIIPLPSNELQTINATYGRTISNISQNPASYWFFIASHNIRNVLVELIPGLGILVATFAAVGTGEIIQAFAIVGGPAYPIHVAPVLVLLLFLFPHTIVELSAYALACASSLYFVVSFFGKERKSIGENLKILLSGAIVSIMLILTAAFFEMLINFWFIIGALMWFPIFFVVHRIRSWAKTQQNVDALTSHG
jgi:uncharacterized membrane protein SpoIIM required for sporulation